MAEVFAFACTVVGADWPATIINERTAGRAKSSYHRDVSDAWPNLPFTQVRVRKLGPALTSEAFRRTARYRGMPDLRCGHAVTVNGRRGVVVGHNDSANFDVLFDAGTDWADAVLNVHPGDLQRAGSEVAERSSAVV